MRTKTTLATVYFFCLSLTTLYTQTFDGIRLSIKGGALYSEINDLETTILSEPFFINYALNKEQKFGYTGGFGLNWELKNSILALNLDVLYALQSSDLVFENFEKETTLCLRKRYPPLHILQSGSASKISQETDEAQLLHKALA